MCKCYLIQLKPFVEDSGPALKKLQMKTIEHSLCGMGWPMYEFIRSEHTYWLSENKEKYKKQYINEAKKQYLKPGETFKSRSFTIALNCYDEMEPGDYLLTRLYDSGDCYIGEVTSKAYYLRRTLLDFQEASCFSWVVDVDWKYIAPFLFIPNALRGLMQGRMNTVQRVKSGSPQSKLIPQLYTGRIEKIPLSMDDFMRALDSLDLEDLVAMYIISKNSISGDEYHVLPSSCKVNEPTYEFSIVNGKQRITCQVKNNEAVDVRKYYESARCFKAVYIFSGKIDYEKDAYPDKPENLIFISHKELYTYLKENDYFREVLSSYYEFAD